LETLASGGDRARLKEVFSPNSAKWIAFRDIPDRLVNAFKATEYFSISRGIVDKHKYGEICARYRAVFPLSKAEAWRCVRCISPRIKFAARLFLHYLEKNNKGTDLNGRRTLNESALAHMIERSEGITNETVSEIFLNSAFLGNRSYGVLEAAQNYFGKSLDELTHAEAAYLAALPEAPARFHAGRKPVEALFVRNLALKSMYDRRFISQADVLKAMNETLRIAK
jgi:membrane carboxypeptidase/penicillin-binding protein